MTTRINDRRGLRQGDNRAVNAGHHGQDIAIAASQDAAQAKTAAAPHEAKKPPVVPPTVDPVKPMDWGAGLGDLAAFEDLDVAFLMTSGPGAGLVAVQSMTLGYLVSSGLNPDGSFLSKLLPSPAFTAGDTVKLMESFSDRQDIVMKGTAFRAGAAADITATAGADSVTGSLESDIVKGAAGNDTVGGLDGNDIVWGDAGNDVIGGGNGQDQLWGGAGNDTVGGGAGADFIVGGSGADSLTGGDDRDILLGGTGNDTILGDAGEDTIVGGAGVDSLTGGDGADTFVFMKGDAGLDGGATLGPDSIADFARGADRIDFSDFAEDFDLVLVNHFKSHAGEFRLVDTDDGTSIRIDTDGDGEADMTINVVTSDKEPLTIGDFAL
ncbi:MAG: calcium-binding protein [Caulobacteraceae bacterium]